MEIVQNLCYAHLYWTGILDRSSMTYTCNNCRAEVGKNQRDRYGHMASVCHFIWSKPGDNNHDGEVIHSTLSQSALLDEKLTSADA